MTGDLIKEAVERNNIEFWPNGGCGRCDCYYGYIFRNGGVVYTQTCDCHPTEIIERPSSYEEIAVLYNLSEINETPLHKEMNKYFKLKEE